MNDITNVRRSLMFLSLAAALALIAPAPASGVDTEPLNNSQLTVDALPQLRGVAAISNRAARGRPEITLGACLAFESPRSWL